MRKDSQERDDKCCGNQEKPNRGHEDQKRGLRPATGLIQKRTASPATKDTVKPAKT